MTNKPTKWGFKFWVITDLTGYTTNFNLYCGKQHTDLSLISGLGLPNDVARVITSIPSPRVLYLSG